MRDNDLAGAVKDLKQDLEQFKSVQLSGADIYTNYNYALSGSYDFTVDASFQTGALYKFTSNRQDLPYAMAYVRFFSNSAMTNAVDPRTMDGGIYLDVAGSSGKTLRWEMLLFNRNAFMVYGKVYCLATDTGVFAHDW